MKKLLFIISISALLNADIVWHKEIKDSVVQAKANGTPVLVFVYEKTCKYCLLSSKAFLNNKALKSAIDKKNIATVAVEKSNPVLSLYGLATNVYPSYFILSGDGELIAKPLRGYVKPGPLSKYLKNVTKWYKSVIKDNKK